MPINYEIPAGKALTVNGPASARVTTDAGVEYCELGDTGTIDPPPEPPPEGKAHKDLYNEIAPKPEAK